MTRYRQCGRAVLNSIGLGFGLVAAAIVGWYSYVEYRRNYWDDKVREMCARDGGIKVIEREILVRGRYVDADGNIRIPPKAQPREGYGPLPFEATEDDLVFYQVKTTLIRDERPRVARDDVQVFRARDNKLLGQATSFGRVGGDAFAVDFESRLRCPVEATESELFKAVFIVDNTREEKK